MSEKVLERKLKHARVTLTLGTVIVLLLAALIILLVLIFTQPVNSAAETMPEVDLEAMAELKSLEDLNAGDVLADISSVDQSRYDSISESEYIESSIQASVEASIALSSAMESLSIEEEENSIAASIYESSVAESLSIEASSIEESRSIEASIEASVAEWEALCAPLAGSHLIPGQVVYNCDDTDIPYLRNLFSNCIVVGNSRAKNAVDCGIMTEREVIYVSGQPAATFGEPVSRGAYLYKRKTLLILGLNDLGYYKSDSFAFQEDYRKLIDLYYSINPNSTLYLQEILPVPDEAAPYFWRYKQIPVFCDRIKELCAEKNCVYVSASDYADFKYINSEDHAHYGKEFYFLWAQTIANQLHLWEDLAGFTYNYPY